MSRKTIFSLFLVILGGFTLLLLLTKVHHHFLSYFLTIFKVGRTRAEHDPFLDPLNNPNIHNADIAIEATDN